MPVYRPTEVARPNQPTEVMRPYQPTVAATPQPPPATAVQPLSTTATHQPQADIVRYGPGVPAAPARKPGRMHGGAHLAHRPSARTVDVTGQITTNGSAGTVSYQWLFRPDRQAPQPLSQSVVAGQHAVYVTVAVQGQGHGSTSQTVTLQILGRDPQAASTAFVVSC
jgi:VCBS repeat-containing protein